MVLEGSLSVVERGRVKINRLLLNRCKSRRCQGINGHTVGPNTHTETEFALRPSGSS